MESLAPIGVCTYVRLQHLMATLNALKDNELARKSELYVFSDGPKEGDEEKVATVRAYLKAIDGFARVTILERKENDRIKNNRGGIRQLLDQYGKMILLEDDVVTAPGFLTFMNMALNKYKENERVFSISGYSPPIKIPEDYKMDIYFLRRFNGWGCGIWKDRFDQIRYLTPEEYEKFTADKTQVREFVSEGGEDMMHMLKMDAYGEIDTGDVKAMYAQFISNQFTVYPRQSLVHNIGHDGTGEHCGISERFNVDLWDKKDNFEFEEEVVLDSRIIAENYRFRKGSMRSRLAVVAKKIGVYSFLKKIINILISGVAIGNK